VNEKEHPKIVLQKITAPVSGMTCASCVARVENSIGKIKGIKQVSVNLATEKATFEIDETFASFSQVKIAVEDAGYKIDFSSLGTNKNKTATKEQSETADKYYEELKKDFLIAVIFTIPIFLISMAMMWENFHSLFNLSLDVTNKILFLLTIPVVFISGKRFYKI